MSICPSCNSPYLGVKEENIEKRAKDASNIIKIIKLIRKTCLDCGFHWYKE